MGIEISPRAARWVLGIACVCFFVTLGLLIRRIVNMPTGENVATVVPVATKVNVAEVVDRHLKWAHVQSAKGLDPQIEPIHAFFEEARAGVRPFAEDALSLTSKFKLVKDYLADGEEHKEYLEERFAARIFTAADLESLVEQVVAAYLNHLDNVDAMLLVNLQADLDGIPAGSFSNSVDRAAIEHALKTAIHEALAAAAADVPKMIGREFVSYVAGEILTAASVELATSAGILSAGAVSGTVTFGIGVLVGMIVDAILQEILDPAGELSSHLDETLIRLEELIVSGYDEEPGLYQRLRDFASLRANARRTAITAVGLPHGEPNSNPSF